VYSDNISAVTVLTGIYANISAANPAGFNNQIINGVSVRAGLSADELSLLGGGSSSASWLVPYYANKLSSSTTQTMWDEYYKNVYEVNIAIERLTASSSSLKPDIKQQLIGEAKFMRAFCLFYLVNLYGDIPLPTSSDYRVNSKLFRSSKEQVYQQIIADLQDSKNLLSDKYLKSDASTPYTSGLEERVRPTRWAAGALLARVYLYIGNWIGAQTEATDIIDNTNLFTLEAIDKVFLKNSREAIWQLQPINTGWNTEDARAFILPIGGPNSYANPVFLDSVNLVNSFEFLDQRKSKWINSVTSGGVRYYYPYKYKSASLNAPVTEYLMIFRLAEQYLIRAEAKAMQGKFQEAIDDVNVIRLQHGGLTTPLLAPTNQSNAITIILHERQVELFTEWGHRWLDLKRTGRVDAVMSIVCSQKGTAWASNWQWYPIPLYDIQQNSNLTQNSGY
jgi:hypothetical protein